MIIIPEQRLVESPYIDWVGHGYTVANGLEMRPAEYNWHLIFTQHQGVRRTLVVGALEAARPLSYVGGAESLWIRFKVGTYMPYLPAPAHVNQEINSGAVHHRNRGEYLLQRNCGLADVVSGRWEGHSPCPSAIKS